MEKDLETAPIMSHHVSVVEFETEDKKKGSFYILLDYQLYGPLERVRYVVRQMSL